MGERRPIWNSISWTVITILICTRLLVSLICKSDFIAQFIYFLYLILNRVDKSWPVIKLPYKMHIAISMLRSYAQNTPGCKITPGCNFNLLHLESRGKFTPGCIFCTRVYFLKTPFTWHKIHPGCKFAPGVQKYTRVQMLHMNTALE